MYSSKEQKGDISLPKLNIQRNRRKQQKGKDQKSLQETQRYQESISCKDGHKKRTETVWSLQKQNILRRGGKDYTEELYKKDLNDPDNHNGVITHLELDILKSKVKWPLGSISTNKASGGDGIPNKLFQILKDDALKILHSIWQQIQKTQQWPQDWNMSFFIPIKQKDNIKECLNTTKLQSFSMLVT